MAYVTIHLEISRPLSHVLSSMVPLKSFNGQPVIDVILIIFGLMMSLARVMKLPLLNVSTLLGVSIIAIGKSNVCNFIVAPEVLRLNMMLLCH